MQYDIGLRWTHVMREPAQVVQKESSISYQIASTLYRDGMAQSCPRILGSWCRRQPHGKDNHPYDDNTDTTLPT